MIASPDVDPALDDDPQAPQADPATATATALPPQVGIPPTAVPATWEDVVRHEATKQKVSPKLALAIMQTESGGKPDATSPKGALGPMQLMPETAKRLGVDPNDPIQNIRGGVAELRRLIDQHGGDVEQVLRGYNGSPTASREATDPYVRTVLGRLGVSSSMASAAPAGQKSNGQQSVDSTSVAAPAASAAVGTPPPTANQAWDAAHPYLAAGRDFGGAVKKAFNPYEQEGRRNLAGMVGATAAGFAAGGVGAVPAFAAAVGAALFTGAEVSAERAITGKGEPGEDVVEAAKQGGMNLAGAAVGKVMTGIPKRLLAKPVSEYAAEHLSAARQATMDAFDAALDTAKTHARSVSTAASRAVRAARGTAAEGVEAAKDTAAAGMESAAAPYTAKIAAPPPTRAIGQQVRSVVQGPAKSTKDAIGQSVEDAAAAGPAISLEGSKAKAQGIFDKQIKDLETYFSGKVTEGGAQAEKEGMQYVRQALAHGIPEDKKFEAATELVKHGVPQDVAEATVEAARHPAAGVLRRIVNAPDEVPFAAAHQFKRQLGEAVDWEHPAKKQVQQITKGVFGSLRSDMAAAEHLPYEEATAQYSRIAQVFNRNYGKQIQKEAIDEPGRFIGRISGKSPEAAKMLRELLVDLPAEQGPEAAQQGLKAWNNVREAWTYNKVIRGPGGIDKLGDRIANLSPEFVQEFFGDREGKAALSNLKQIHTAYQQAVESGKITVESAKSAGKVSVERTIQAGENATEAEAANLQKIRAQRRVALKPTAEEIRFKEGSVAPKRTASPEEMIMDTLRAYALGPQTYWGALALGRLMHGPSSEELVHWAASSPAGTKALVNVFTHPAIGQGLANLYRMYTGHEAPSPVTPPPDGRFLGDGRSGGVSQTQDGSGAATTIGQPPPR